ncbi:MAG: hypothetical protein JRF37_04730 [Deltaproteobacteria bacterium]|nr:hypothetical protein [Deltaproteobacteria bacterium]
MINTTVERQLREHLERLPVNQQRQVVQFARTLVKTAVQGVPGKELLQFAGTIDPKDLVSIEQAIKEGCEMVNPDEW